MMLSTARCKQYFAALRKQGELFEAYLAVSVQVGVSLRWQLRSKLHSQLNSVITIGVR